MRKLWIFVVILLALCGVGQALATASPSEVKERSDRLSYFSVYAKMFGCTKNIHNKFTSVNISEMQFMPPAKTVAGWTQLFTVIGQTLPDGKTLSASAIQGYAANLMDNYARHARIVDSKLFKANDDTPIIYMEYTDNSGLYRESGIGVYGRHTNDLAAFMRYEVRGRALTDAEKASMLKIVEVLKNR